jgi:hypothetical protein
MYVSSYKTGLIFCSVARVHAKSSCSVINAQLPVLVIQFTGRIKTGASCCYGMHMSISAQGFFSG